MQLLQPAQIINTFKSKAFRSIAVASFAVSVIVLFYFHSIPDLAVFPGNSFQFVPYNDATTGGKSTIYQYTLSDTGLSISFKLLNDVSSPYVGISTSPKNKQPFNLSRYNVLKIKIKGEGVNHLGMAFYLPLQGDDNVKEINRYTSIVISNQAKEYCIPLDQFKVPFWWFEVNNLNSDMNLQPSLDRIICLNISNAYTTQIEETKSIDIYSISFTRDNKSVFFIILVTWLLVCTVALVILLLLKKATPGHSSITITYQPVDASNEIGTKSDVLQFISNHFHQNDLTIELVSAETGVSPRKIASFIQNQYSCNFKTWLNRLRINESKRLLLETGLNIGEVAYKVGFNNQSHFNRVFKTEMNISPSEFRDQNMK